MFCSTTSTVLLFGRALFMSPVSLIPILLIKYPFKKNKGSFSPLQPCYLPVMGSGLSCSVA